MEGARSAAADGAHVLRLESAAVADLARVRRFVAEASRSLGVPNDLEPDLVLAADEAVTNVLRHGYGGQPGAIEVEVRLDGDDIVVRLRDRAPPFDPTMWPEPDLGLPLEARSAGGFGIHLARASCDRIVHRRLPDGNEVELIKALATRGRSGS